MCPDRDALYVLSRLPVVFHAGDGGNLAGATGVGIFAPVFGCAGSYDMLRSAPICRAAMQQDQRHPGHAAADGVGKPGWGGGGRIECSRQCQGVLTHRYAASGTTGCLNEISCAYS